MAERARERALETAGLLHPAREAVTAAVFVEHPEFFAAFDKVQVKYEMLRAHLVVGDSVTAAAAAHGYSRASFYLVARAFEESGMVGLLDERPGRRGPVKLSAEVLAFLEARRLGVTRSCAIRAGMGSRAAGGSASTSAGARGARRRIVSGRGCR